MSFLSRLFTWWNGATLGTLLFTRRHGVEVGRDGEGNTYYRSKAGKRRWVIYNGLAEASRVPPEWHLWLHHADMPPPSEAPVEAPRWVKPHVPNLTGTGQAHMPSGSLAKVGRRARATGDYEAWVPD